ncbi:hypothetical protein BD410DRAFT_790340 [Rickenella mellea]|uniref:Uncharacterized protein n=1 Tax=Rickenella mellea TaxID=50990 RepID=A0A4Y7Q171_9AGAM|nr:hypothetical protein BD410DRAFT_790340 [Rickenella mellea]
MAPRHMIDRAGRAAIRHSMASCPPEAKFNRLHAIANRYNVKVDIVSRIIGNRLGEPDDLAQDVHYLDEKKFVGSIVNSQEKDGKKTTAAERYPTDRVDPIQSEKPSAKKKKAKNMEVTPGTSVSESTQSTAVHHSTTSRADRDVVVIQPPSQSSQTKKRLRSAQHEVIDLDNDVEHTSGSPSVPSPERYRKTKGRSDDRPEPVSPLDGPPPAKRPRRDQDFASFLSNVGLKRLAPAFADAGFATSDELKSFLAYSKLRKEQIIEKLWTAQSINLKDWADFNDALDHSR